MKGNQGCGTDFADEGGSRHNAIWFIPYLVAYVVVLDQHLIHIIISKLVEIYQN